MPNAVETEPLVVSTVEGVGPHLRLPYSRLPEVEAAFKAHNVPYWVSENVIAFNDGPGMIRMYFGLKGDPAQIQSVLDEYC